MQKDNKLLEACENGNKEIVLDCLKRKLFSKPADINTKNKYGKTPLHLAAGKGHKDIVQLLISQGQT